MNPDDPIDDLTESVSEGVPVDWRGAEASARSREDKASVRGLRHLAQIAEYHRRLQRPQLLREEPERTGETHGVTRPEQWGHLTLLELVSSGASGEVWRAWDAWLQREVALKFLLNWSGPAPGGASDSALLEESRTLARVRHAGVVAVHGIAEHDGRVGMWMELLHGTTLATEIERRGALPAQEVATSSRRTGVPGRSRCFRVGEGSRRLHRLERTTELETDPRPAKLIQAIERAMARQAETRYGSAASLATDLESVLQQLSLSVLAVEGRRVASPQRHWLSRWASRRRSFPASSAGVPRLLSYAFRSRPRRTPR